MSAGEQQDFPTVTAPLDDPITGARFAKLCCQLPGDTVPGRRSPSYCKTHYVLPRFDLVPSGVLVTHNSDQSATNVMARDLPERVSWWYSTNCRTTNPRCMGLPLGLRNAPDLLGPVRKAAQQPKTQPHRAYLCASIPARVPWHKRERKQLYRLAQTLPCVTVEGGDPVFGPTVPYADYCRRVRDHGFVVSPAGAGIDCHRMWEALYLGAIPICRAHAELRWFAKLPILFVGSWSDVTPQLLERAWLEHSPKFHDPDVMALLTFGYWRTQIERACENHRLRHPA